MSQTVITSRLEENQSNERKDESTYRMTISGNNNNKHI